MILTQEKQQVEITGFDENESKLFNIKQNRQMFDLLSSNIYSDKITACLREYSCNALDSHIAAGRAELPFTVHLPNHFEPWFSVRDYGVGLSHDQVMNLYTTYGESSKTNSNDFVGALGLGSKSAFAYSDQFTVTARYDGAMRQYSAYVNEDGTPCIMMLSEEPTDECNGVEIYMAVAEKDFDQFAKKAATVFFRFPVTPEITGNVIEMPVVKYVVDKPEYKLRERNSRYDNQKSYAIQGPVAYPIDAELITEMTPEDQRILNNTPFDIHFPIGSVNISASRERLTYDKMTRKAVLDSFLKIKEVIKDEFADVFVNCKTMWDAKCTFHSWMDENNYRYNTEFKNLIKQTMNFQGQEIKDARLSFPLVKTKHDPMDMTLDMAVSDYYPPLEAPLTKNTLIPLTKSDKILRYEYAESEPREYNSNYSTEAERSGYKFVFVDVEIKTKKELNELIWYNMYSLACRNPDDNYDGRLNIIVVDPSIDYDEFAAYWHGIPYILASSLKPVPKDQYAHVYRKHTKYQSTTRVVNPTVKMYKITCFNQNGDHSGVPNATVDMDKTNYYFMNYTNKPVIPGTEKDVDHTLNHVLFAAGRLGFFNAIKDNIYSVNYSQRAELEKYTNFVPIYDYLKSKALPLIQNKKFLEAYVSLKEIEELAKEELLYFRQKGETLVDVHSAIIKHGPMKKFISSVMGYYAEVFQTLGLDSSIKSGNIPDYIQDVLGNVRFMGDKVYREDNTKYLKTIAKIKDMFEKVNETYPLIIGLMLNGGHKYIHGNYKNTTAKLKDIYHYINLVDQTTKTKRKPKEKLNELNRQTETTDFGATQDQSSIDTISSDVADPRETETLLDEQGTSELSDTSGSSESTGSDQGSSNN